MRDAERAARWQRRFDGWVLLAAVISVLGVALQLLPSAWHPAGLVLSWLAWATFAAEAVLMLLVSPAPARWARSHLFDLAVIVLACPAWQLLLYDLLLAELVPALTVLETVKLAKLVKSARVVRRRLSGQAWQPAAVAVMLVATAAVAVEVVRH